MGTPWHPLPQPTSLFLGVSFVRNPKQVILTTKTEEENSLWISVAVWLALLSLLAWPANADWCHTTTIHLVIHPEWSNPPTIHLHNHNHLSKVFCCCYCLCCSGGGGEYSSSSSSFLYCHIYIYLRMANKRAGHLFSQAFLCEIFCGEEDDWQIDWLTTKLHTHTDTLIHSWCSTNHLTSHW